MLNQYSIPLDSVYGKITQPVYQRQQKTKVQAPTITQNFDDNSLL